MVREDKAEDKVKDKVEDKVEDKAIVSFEENIEKFFF